MLSKILSKIWHFDFLDTVLSTSDEKKKFLIGSQYSRWETDTQNSLSKGAKSSGILKPFYL